MKPPRFLSKFRKNYMLRFAFRSIVFVASVLLYIFAREQFDVLYGFDCFKRFSVLDLLWVVWIVSMILQLVPCRKYWPMGSQKALKDFFEPVTEDINRNGLLEYIKKCNLDTLKIGVVWFALICAVGLMYYFGLFQRGVLLIISIAFYVCDLICVLFWCPFRVWFMKNRCCTTCRIFNWDHMMMFSPIVFIPGFYTWTLCLMAFVVFVVWEVTFATHPERFWSGTNSALLCGNCTDKLCGNRNCQMDIPFDNLKL